MLQLQASYYISPQSDSSRCDKTPPMRNQLIYIVCICLRLSIVFISVYGSVIINFKVNKSVYAVSSARNEMLVLWYAYYGYYYYYCWNGTPASPAPATLAGWVSLYAAAPVPAFPLTKAQSWRRSLPVPYSSHHDCHPVADVPWHVDAHVECHRSCGRLWPPGCSCRLPPVVLEKVIGI